MAVAVSDGLRVVDGEGVPVRVVDGDGVPDLVKDVEAVALWEVVPEGISDVLATSSLALKICGTVASIE